MFKKIIILAVIAFSVINFAGCSGGKALELDPQEAIATITNEITFNDTLMAVNEITVASFYPGLAEVADSFSIQISATAITTEEIAVVKVKEGSTAADVRARLEFRVSEQKFRYEAYLPEQLPKLENAVIEAKGDYVIMIICEDDTKAKSVISKLFK